MKTILSLKHHCNIPVAISASAPASCLEVDTDSAADHERVVDMHIAIRVVDVLQIRLEIQGAVLERESVRQFRYKLVILDYRGWHKDLLVGFSRSQILAESTV